MTHYENGENYQGEERRAGAHAEMRKNRNFRIGTAAGLTMGVLAILGTAITYGRSIVTRDDMQQQLAPLYQRIGENESEIEQLRDDVSLLRGRIDAQQNDPPAAPHTRKKRNGGNAHGNSGNS